MRAPLLLLVLTAVEVFACGGCSADPASAPPDAGVVVPPHCSRPSAVACDQPAHRQDHCICDADAQCESGFCGLDTKYCARVCEWRPVAVTLGARCDCERTCPDATRCLEACPAETYCKDLGAESRCAPLEDVDGPCDVGVPRCKVGLLCVSGSCQPPKIVAEGGACGDAAWCMEDAFCRAGVCTKKRVAGEPCSGAWECADRFASCEPCGSGGDAFCCSASHLGAPCGAGAPCVAAGLYCSALDARCRAVHPVGGACDPADVPEACPRDPLTRFSSTCDPTTRTCVGGYCL